ncbi:5'-nucleotidase C-terminal domain-containing protein [Oceanirhabdus seepicola]|uniref:5'-nucleotidase C-terminal domain-containing protein n=1 Tax=Oceanirhabdus seepicola TaxID=2828781 RepID=A0A9J6P4M9_9CLOT|nr:5'-nucleotidase C-terminal domain-containing protein [Oceanirhabdus seepicola]MCM1991049.1 5'-nucleotidase C-terminal domain-containing protein [Oceanirhabdus seepicola]
MNKGKVIFSLFLCLIMILMFFSPSSIFAETNDRKVIDIITINDFHGKLKEDTREKGKNMGMSKIINAVKQYKDVNPNTIVVSGGDSYQGSAMSELTLGAPVSEMYKEIGVVASAVGNHEFDWGIDLFKKWSEVGEFDFLATNIVDKKTNKPIRWVKPYKVIEVEGVKIALIGLTTPETDCMKTAKNAQNLMFEPLKESAQKWVKYFKNLEAPEGKVDAIIALAHVGCFQDRDSGEITGEVVELGLTEVEGLDAIISAHTHQSVAGVVNNIAVVQGYKDGRALGKLSLSFDKDNNLVKVDSSVDLLYNRKSELVNDKQGDAIYLKYSKALKSIIDEVIGRTDENLTHVRFSECGTSVLGKWTTDLMRKIGGTQIAVINEGALRTSIPAGDITVGKLYDVIPFNNILIKMKLKGSQLKKVIENGIMNKDIGWIEISGVKVYYNPEAEFGNRVTAIILEDGVKVEMEKYYSVATNDFMFIGGDNYDFKGAKNIVESNRIIRDMIADYLRDVKEVKFEFEQPFVKGKAPKVK